MNVPKWKGYHYFPVPLSEEGVGRKGADYGAMGQVLQSDGQCEHGSPDWPRYARNACLQDGIGLFGTSVLYRMLIDMDGK